MDTTDVTEGLVRIIIEALDANDDPSRVPWDIVREAMQQSGMRRAAWATYSRREQERIVNAAMRLRQEKAER